MCAHDKPAASLLQDFNRYGGQGSSQQGNYHSSDCGTASAQSLEAGNWVVATATKSSRTKTETDDYAAVRETLRAAQTSSSNLEETLRKTVISLLDAYESKAIFLRIPRLARGRGSESTRKV